jgi:transposase
LQNVSDLVKLSRAELQRVRVIQDCLAKRRTNAQAAELLNVSVRQLKRLKRRYRQDGAHGLASRQRERPSHNQLAERLKTDARVLLRTHYADFGPTLAHEKLVEEHQLPLSRESVRQLMIGAGLWTAHRQKRATIHPLRERRARRGELVQLDGSPFAWFEDRSPECTLLVYIDDATGELMELFFVDAESTHAYFQATENYLNAHGRPVAFYTDKLGVFRINHPNAVSGEGLTQFARAMKELDIELICANSPQAKGRVERMNQTLQDRLPKELRLRGISDPITANVYLSEFRADFNRRFAVCPREEKDAHRPLRATDLLARILAVCEVRTLSKNLTVNYQNVIYQIQTLRPRYALRNVQVQIRERWDGALTILYKGKPLNYTMYREPPRQAELIPSKELNAELDARRQPKKKRKVYVPPADHPWRKFQIHPKSDSS